MANNAEIITEYGVEYFRNGKSDGWIVPTAEERLDKEIARATKFDWITVKIHKRTVVYGDWSPVEEN